MLVLHFLLINGVGAGQRVDTPLVPARLVCQCVQLGGIPFTPPLHSLLHYITPTT